MDRSSALSTLIIALPWYLKNYIWTGNPVFPLYFPQNIIDPNQLSIWMDYVNSFGTGKAWYDYLLLPVNLFLQHEKFGTFMASMEMASPLFLFVLVYPWARQRIQETYRKTLDILSLLTVAQFVAWAIGSQQTRFLLPTFSGLSILASAVMMSLSNRLVYKSVGRSITIGLTGGMVVVTCFFMGIYIGLVKPERPILGVESKNQFLTRMLRDYPAIEYINNELPESAKVMFLWDGRGYYCDGKCLADVDQSRWTGLTQENMNNYNISSYLNTMGVTHFVVSIEDISYFLQSHDDEGKIKIGSNYLLMDFLPNCAIPVYKNIWVEVFRFNSENKGCHQIENIE